MIWAIILLATILAAIPTLMFFVNLLIYRRPQKRRSLLDSIPAVSVLIPARNEEHSIGACLDSVLAQQDVDLEVLVLDDQSEDQTAAVVEHRAERDHRVRLIKATPLPEGWCGKQFACYSLAQQARTDRFLFIDADVRLLPSSIAGLLQSMERRQADLLSGIPRQLTGSFLEKLLLPLIHFILLGFLPMPAMRLSRHAKFAAGCGQLMLARRQAYFKAQGHAAIRQSLHDGLKLPRAFRAAGASTDLVDATTLATCRMYTSSRETWAGLSKNATEGLAAPGVIGPMTFLLAGGQILPFILGLFWPVLPEESRTLVLGAMTCAWLPRWVSVVWFRQSILSALLHPLGVLLTLIIQWQASIRAAKGMQMEWKGRSYSSGTTSAPPTLKAHPPVMAMTRKNFLWLLPAGFLAALAMHGTRANEAANTTDSKPQQAPAMDLEDQFGNLHSLKFPNSRLVLLLAADKKGAEDIGSWLPYLRKTYAANKRPFELLGLADVSAVPGPLRPLVRRKFRKEHKYPVMMDWQGDLIGSLQLEADTANVFLIQTSGKVVHKVTGKASVEKWNHLDQIIRKQTPHLQR